MNVGDLLEHETIRWAVRKLDRAMRSALIENEAEVRTVANDLDRDPASGWVVIANPPTQWPTISVPIRRGAGPIVILTQPKPSKYTKVFRRWYDWVPADSAQEGGSLFFNPELKLRIGDFLLATHKGGAVSRISVPTAFGTIGERKARSVPKVKPEIPSIYDRILVDEDDEEES